MEKETFMVFTHTLFCPTLPLWIILGTTDVGGSIQCAFLCHSVLLFYYSTILLQAQRRRRPAKRTCTVEKNRNWNVEKNEIIDLITDHPKVSNVHHVHIWALSSTQNALTAHVIPKEEYSLEEVQGIKNELKHDLEHHKIQHATLEFGSNNVDCCDPKC